MGVKLVPSRYGKDRLKVFENRVLTRIFGLKGNEVTERWRNLHRRELHNFHSSQNIIRKIKARRMRWAGQVVATRNVTNTFRTLV
jgi:hypothetical protein